MTEANEQLRVLLSEGSSTSGREALTILGLKGHIVEVCDPSRYCIARFSRFVRIFHHCPGLREHPDGYLAFVIARRDAPAGRDQDIGRHRQSRRLVRAKR